MILRWIQPHNDRIGSTVPIQRRLRRVDCGERSLERTENYSYSSTFDLRAMGSSPACMFSLVSLERIGRPPCLGKFFKEQCPLFSAHFAWRSLPKQAAFVACWASGLPLVPPVSEKESAPWEWNSAVLFVMMLAVLWAAFLTRGGLVDETKRAACAWCALAFSGGFVLCSFSWAALGLKAHSLATSVVLALETVVLVVAAAV